MFYFRYYCPNCNRLTVHELRDTGSFQRICTCCGFCEHAASRSRAVKELVGYERYLRTQETNHPEIGELKRPGDQTPLPEGVQKGEGFN